MSKIKNFINMGENNIKYINIMLCKLIIQQNVMSN